MVLSSTYKKMCRIFNLGRHISTGNREKQAHADRAERISLQEVQRVPNRSRANRSLCGYPFGMISPLKLKKGDNSGTQANVPKQAGA